MELAEQRYQHWCAQKTLDPELRQELAAMQNDADKITDAFYAIWSSARPVCAAFWARARTG